MAPCDSRAVVEVHGQAPAPARPPALGRGDDDGAVEARIHYERACLGLSPLDAKRATIALVLPVFVALSWIPSIKAIAPLAKAANVFFLSAIGVTLLLACQALLAGGAAESARPWPHDPHVFLLFVGNCFYAFEGCATVVPILHAMEDQGGEGGEMGASLHKICITV